MIWRIVVYWLLGLTWALVVGHLVTKFVLNRIRAFLVAAGTAAGDTGTLPWSIGTGVPSWLTGTIERLFFTTAVAFELSGVATAMMAWMGVKLAANWNRRSVASCAPRRASTCHRWRPPPLCPSPP